MCLWNNAHEAVASDEWRVARKEIEILYARHSYHLFLLFSPLATHHSPLLPMLDPNFIRDNLDAVKANCINRKRKNSGR